MISPAQSHFSNVSSSRSPKTIFIYRRGYNGQKKKILTKAADTYELWIKKKCLNNHSTTILICPLITSQIHLLPLSTFSPLILIRLCAATAKWGQKPSPSWNTITSLLPLIQVIMMMSLLLRSPCRLMYNLTPTIRWELICCITSCMTSACSVLCLLRLNYTVQELKFKLPHLCV